MSENVFVLPLSSAQERLWFLHQLEPYSSAYNLPAAVRLRGQLDIALVEHALAAIVARHEVLRTRIDLVEGAPAQLVSAECVPALARVDLCELPEPLREQELARLLAREARRPFDLTCGPLLRTTLVRLGARDHVLLWVVHHVVFDGASTNILLAEFAALYEASRLGEPAPLPELPLQYGDFADWERRRLASGALEPQLAYWKSELSPDAALALPFDRPRAPVQRQRGERLFFSLPVELARGLRQLSQAEQVSLFSLLLAGYAALLARLSGEDALQIGTPVTSRTRPELAALVGCFANTAVVRAELGGDPPFARFARRVHERVQRAQAHGEVPFDRVVEAVNPARDLSRAPLCQVFFALQPGSASGPRMHGIEATLLDLDSGAAQFDLALELCPDGEELSGAIEYDRDLFERDTVARIAAQYRRLLESAVRAPDAPVCALAISSPEELSGLRARGRIRRPARAEQTVLARIRAQAARAPEAIAVEQEAAALSYGELIQRVDALADVLVQRGARVEERVAIVLSRSLDAIVALLATLEAGAAYVPIDPGYPRERVAELLALSRACVIVTAPEHSALVPEGQLERVLELSAPPGLTSRRGRAPTHDEQAAYVIFTSGSTGQPKGVVVSQGALAAFVESALEQYQLTATDRVLQFASLSFDASVEEIFPALACGATLVLRREDMVAAPSAFLQAADALAISVLDLPTSFWHRIAAESGDTLRLPSALRLLILGGEALLAERVQQLCAQAAGRVRVVNSYGPTEATVVATACDVGVDTLRRGGSVPIGGPLAHVELLVLDGRLLPVPVGVTGDLYLGGAGLARGYAARPRLTAAAFVPHPFASRAGERLYATGDRVRYRGDGALEFVGRADHQVKVRGYRIELGELEARLAQLAGVREVLVDARRGPAESAQLVAYVAGAELSADDLRAALCSSVPDYMVPAHIVTLAELPKTRHGKIDRAALGRLEVAPVTSERPAPRDPREQGLLALWEATLGRSDISVHDNFFALGGDSILALSLVARARDRGLSFTARDLLQHQTIAELARALALVRTRSAPPPPPRAGAVPLTPIQRWFFEHAGPDPHHWNQSLWLRARTPLEPERLAGALARVTARHDAFRLRFVERTPGGWQQSLQEVVGTRFVREDLRALAPPAREQQLVQRAQQLQRALDLGAGPLLIAALFELGEEGQRLFLVAHHLVVDGVSWRVLAHEMAAEYRGAPAPEFPISFAYWAARTAGATWTHAELQPLVPDVAAGRALEADTARVVARFEVEETERLRRQAGREGLRIEELLVAAFARALAAHTADARVLLELEAHGRDAADDAADAEQLDLSRTVGWLTSLRTVELAVPRTEAPLELAHDVAKQLRAADGRGQYGRADVAFNYLGQWDGALASESPFELTDFDVGDERDPQARRTHALELDALLADGWLRLTYSFSAARHRVASVERLNAQVLGCLRALSAQEQEESYPLTPLQQGLLFHSLWEPEHDPYVEQVSCRLEGALDLAAFRAAWAQVSACHEVLRTVFDSGQDEPRQRILPQVELELSVVDLRPLDAAAQQAQVARHAAAERARGFDLRAGPLTRFGLLRLRDDAWHFLWTHHHLILDGWSAALVLRDVFSVYQGLCSGQPVPLAARGAFRDYIAWLRRRDPSSSDGFWRASLAGFAAPTALPFERARRGQGERRAQHSEARSLSPQLSARVEEFARRQHVTLNTLVEAAWALVLARSARSADVLFGVTSSGRSADLPGASEIAGLFINTLPLRIAVDAAQPVGAYVRSVAARGRECRAHEHSALGEIQGHSAVPKGQPLFESLLVFENYPADARLERGVPGLAVHDVAFMEETNYALTWLITPGTRLSLRVALDPRRFEARACASLLDALESTLVAFVRDADAPLGCSALLAGFDPATRLGAWNATEAPLDDALLVHERFAAHAARRPDELALVFAGRHVSYGELDQRANQLAHALIALGVGPDVLVAVAAERSIELVVALLGILKAGGAYVPIDPEYPSERVEFMLRDAAAPVLVSQWPIVARLGLNEGAARLLCLDADRAQIECMPRTAPARRPHPLQLAYSIYTSGSTGRPKGAGNSHRALLNRLLWMQEQYGLTGDDRVLQKTPFSFDVSVWEFFWPLMVGASLVVAEPGDHRDAQRLSALIERERVTTLHFVPPMLQAFLEAATPAAYASLRRIVCSGEALPVELAQRSLTRCDAALHNLYGPTEAAIDVSFWQCRPDEDAASTPIGRPIANTQLYVLDACAQPLPAGLAGELYIGGVALARGYHLRPALTAERFVPDPFGRTAGARLYRTGDLARQREDGVLEFLGRLDHQVKIRGLRVELGEIEARLLQLHQVREAVVVARQEAHGGKRLVAYVSGSGELDTEHLRAALGETLPAYMVPAQVIVLERLPLSPNGKVERRALPEPDQARAGVVYVAPRTEAERILAEVWSDVLRVPHVGVDDDFFALGGDSVVSLQVIARAAQRGLTLTPKALFEHPTVAGAAAVARATEPPRAHAEPAATASLSADEWRDLLDELDR
jgi:amino acid adenylation domain-containing protein/non-ribosomal peptide synthase protein (TIGR01720 family)